ncbi:MAG: hypothetical protein KBD36_02030 [Alphaproteobacteria bacterium]|jgi:hypothetical protein|nr:hypothetical protein [Alphaproteobacteria bacterium]MBP9776611.1 hypothetical protein [Alphaproteobacteria bacterium]
MRHLLLTCLIFLLAACTPAAQLPEPIGLAYLSNKPIRLDVARIEVVKKYKSSSQPPHVENDFPVPPVAMIQQWVQDRLVPVGKTGHAVVTIEEASIIEIPLKGTKGFKGMFTVDQSEQYDAKMTVKIEIFDDFGNAKGYAYARTQGSRTIAENFTLGQRRKVWIVMMEKIMNNLDEELDRNVRGYLGQYIS